MPTISGLRRRGYTPQSIRNFAEAIGVSKKNGIVELQQLEYYGRDHLNKTSNRVMAVVDPLKVVIENYPDDQVEHMEAVNNPEDEAAGTRTVPFSKVLYIERADFMEDPPRKFYRLAPGREVRLRWGYYITCTDVIKDGDGQVIELRCTYDPATKGGYAPDGRRVKATLHWVSAEHAIQAEARLYDTLFTEEVPDGDDEQDFTAFINPKSVEIVDPVYIEPYAQTLAAGDRVQFERLAYFVVDPDSTADKLIFNRTVTLRDQWKKVQKKNKKKQKNKQKNKQK